MDRDGPHSIIFTRPMIGLPVLFLVLLVALIPIEIYNFIESIGNVKSAQTAGDNYNIRTSVWVDLRNKVMISDALHTERPPSRSARQARSMEAESQPQLQDPQDWFGPKVPLPPGLTTSSQLNDFLDWPFLQQVFHIQRTIAISKNGKTDHETIDGITSLSAGLTSPTQLLGMLRSYWQIENRLHYP